MTYHKFVAFENVESITKKLQDHWRFMLDSTILNAKAFYFDEINSVVPELIEQFQEKQLKFNIGRAFVTIANSSIPIHLDGTLKMKKHFALNWPVFNTNDSTMNWYDPINRDEIVVLKNENYSSEIPIYNKDNCRLLESFVLSRPTMVKVDTPHDVINYSNMNRVILSFRFDPEPFYLWDNL